MKFAVVLLSLLSAAAHAEQVFLQAGDVPDEPIEVVTNVKKVPVVGGQFRTSQGVTVAM